VALVLVDAVACPVVSQPRRDLPHPLG
jgi:hypothetical protein